MKKYIYGSYLGDKVWQSAFDLIMVLANPVKAKFTKTHVTVMGPYDDEIDLEAIPFFNARTATIDKVEMFDTPRGNAVVLLLDILGVEKIFHKPDYPCGLPHITIYEGKDSDFAKKLVSMLAKIDLSEVIIPISRITQININLYAPQEFENYAEMRWLYGIIVKQDHNDVSLVRGFADIRNASANSRLLTIRWILMFISKTKKGNFDSSSLMSKKNMGIDKERQNSDLGKTLPLFFKEKED